MYMVLTRSFISSYLIISSDNDEEICDNIDKKLKMVITNGELTIKEPTESEKEQKRTAIISKKNINKSQKEVNNAESRVSNAESTLKNLETSKANVRARINELVTIDKKLFDFIGKTQAEIAKKNI